MRGRSDAASPPLIACKQQRVPLPEPAASGDAASSVSECTPATEATHLLLT